MHTDDVANTVSNEIHSRHGSLLRIPRHITTDQTEKGNERRGASLREVVARQTTIVATER
jgi:hypothetical protein